MKKIRNGNDNNEAKQQKVLNTRREGLLHNPANVTTGYENVEQPVQTAITASTSGSAEASVHTDVEQPNRQVPTLPIAIGKQNEQSSRKVDIKQCFLDAITTGRWSEVVSALNILDKAMLLQVIDGGGQPSFQEIFPLLIGCPAVKLIIFKLTDDLQTPYPVEYQPKHGRAQTWHDSGYVVRDFIFQAISSLPDLTTTDIPTKIPFDPKLLLVGTHKDELKGSEEMKAREIQEYAESIHDLICQTKEFESQAFNWIKDKNMGDFIVGVSNTNQKDIMEVKTKIEQLILQTDPIGIPAPWLVFDFVLHKYAKSQQLHKVEREMCNEIAKVCYLKDDEIEYVLYFLHNKAGTILYYHDIPELRNWIITDFQVLIDSISEVIIQYFDGNGNIGRMGQVKIETLRSIDGFLDVNQLLSLMKHRHIISYKETATTFFMPSLLPKAEGIPVSSQSSDSLLVIFKSGYSPIGLFCAVSTHLIDSHNWEINTSVGQCRNIMSFYYVWSGAQYGIVFTAFSTYYEVHLSSNVEYPPKMKFDIYKAIQASFTTVCKDIDLIPPSYGFYCTCKGAGCPQHAHPAKVGDGYEKMECCYSGVQIELTQQQRTWFHIYQINHKEHRNDFNIPDAIKDVCCDVYTIQLSENGCLHKDDRHGFSIDFPSGVLLPNQSITLTIGVMVYGPFMFPEGVRPMSPILWVFGDTNMDLKLLKDAEVILPHYLDIDERDVKEFEILFLKACPMNHYYAFNNKKQKYLFKSIGNATLLNDHKAAFSTNHFCSLCLATNVSESIKDKIEYCMTVFIDITTRMYTFVVSYCLETCTETLKKYFNPVNKKTKFNFKCTENMLTMHCSDVPQWILSLLKGKRIELTALDIWNADSDKLKWKEKEGLYFPSFELQFDPVNASTQSSKVSISFLEIERQIELPLLVNTPPVPATSGGSGSPNASLGGNPDNQAAVELNLVSLMSFPAARNRELNLTEEIGVKYSTLGVFLLNDGQGKITDALEQQYQKDASLITQAIFKRWLQGAGAQPVAWSTLVHVLRKMKLCALADEIENVTLLI